MTGCGGNDTTCSRMSSSGRTRSNPGIGGRTDTAPGLSTSLSKARSEVAPSTVEHTRTVWASTSMATTSLSTRTSSRNRSWSFSGVWSSRSSSSSITPPTK